MRHCFALSNVSWRMPKVYLWITWALVYHEQSSKVLTCIFSKGVKTALFKNWMTKKCEKENWKKKTAHLLKYGLNRALTYAIYKHKDVLMINTSTQKKLAPTS